MNRIHHIGLFDYPEPPPAFGQPYTDPSKPGRLDVNGVEWFACDPYPTWFRWEDMTTLSGKLFRNPARWADLPPVDSFTPNPLFPAEAMYGHRCGLPLVDGEEKCPGDTCHLPNCDRVIKTRWSGVSCDCRILWYCA